MTATYWSGAGVGGVLPAAAGIAVLVGQPRYVAGSLALTGVLVMIAFAMSIRQLRRLYDEAELRKTVAADI